jgi:hypothetical protein
MNSLSARDLVFIGLRDVDEAEKVFIKNCGIKNYSMQEVDEYGLAGMMDRLLTSIDPTSVDTAKIKSNFQQMTFFQIDESKILSKRLQSGIQQRKFHGDAYKIWPVKPSKASSFLSTVTVIAIGNGHKGGQNVCK